MSFSLTEFFGLRKPKVGNDWGKWGDNLNYSLDKIDEELYYISRKFYSISLPSFSNQQILGFYKELYNAITLSATPVDAIVGSSKLVFEVTAGGPGTIIVSGKELKQNSLNTVNTQEEIGFEGAGLFISKKTWTEELQVVCSEGCTVNIYAYSGFSLDKKMKLNKILFKGKCTDLINQIDIKAKFFSIDYNSVVIAEETGLSVDKTFGSGSEFYWHKELSISKELLSGIDELVLDVSSPSPSSWKDILIILSWE